jgi:hypothetical protein
MNTKHAFIIATALIVAIVGGMTLHAYLSSSRAEATYAAIKKEVAGQVATLQQQIAANDKQAADRNASIDAQLAAAKSAAQQLALIRQWSNLPPQDGRRSTLIDADRPQSQNSDPRSSAEISGPALPAAPSASLTAPEVSAIAQQLAAGQKCASDLAACKSDLTDTGNQKQLLAKRATAAEQALKGGSFWKRLKADTKWLAIGGLIGGGLVAGVKR